MNFFSPELYSQPKLSSRSIILILAVFIGQMLPVQCLGQNLYTVDKTRGEWTLMVIPDTQGYIEDWPEEGYEYSVLVTTFDWIRGTGYNEH